jgi:hypothetical protein
VIDLAICIYEMPRRQRVVESCRLAEHELGMKCQTV